MDHHVQAQVSGQISVFRERIFGRRFCNVSFQAASMLRERSDRRVQIGLTDVFVAWNNLFGKLGFVSIAGADLRAKFDQYFWNKA